MNIFILDNDPARCARYHCDKHLIKMITETCQILSTVYTYYWKMCSRDVPTLYLPTHVNHPCVKWAAERYDNFRWLVELGKELIKEYEYRYNKPKNFQRARAILFRLSSQGGYFKEKMTAPALCMPQECKQKNAVKAYRGYYIKHKQHLLIYTNRPIPKWMPKILP